MKRLLPAFLIAGLFGQVMFGQGDSTRAKSTDWEEINFEFNQSVLVDGFPSLLRLADLLKQHPDYKVTLVGNTDQIGSNRYNDTLSLQRANAVAQFLQKYGAGSGQVQVRGDGKKNLEVDNRGVNPRFMNRRVVVTVTAPDGTVIGDGSMTSVINDFEKYARGQLSKIDGILAQLQDLANQVRALQGDTGAIRQDTGQIKTTTTAVHGDTQELIRRPIPLTAEQTTEIARVEATRAADYALTQAALRNKKYSLVGIDIGPTFANGRTGNYSGDIFGKALIPFGNGQTADQPGTHGLQVDGDWVYFHKKERRRDGLSDGLFDVGVVNRWNHVQVGTFAQFDYVNFNAYQGGGLLGAGVITTDFVFRGGMLGFFAAKGFKEYANIGTSSTGGPLFPVPAYIRYDDQIGFHAAGTLGEHLILESSVAFKKRYSSGAKTPSAYIKLTFPANDHFAWFVQADENTTFQNFSNGDRLVFGIQFGNWLRPKDYANTTGVIPVDVPRAHYELLAR